MEEINSDTSLDIFLSTSGLGPSFSQSSCAGPRPIYREIYNVERNIEQEEAVHNTVVLWSNDLTDMPLPLPRKKYRNTLLLTIC